MKRYIAKNEIQFYTVNAVSIAKGLGLGGRFNMVMQSAFFKLANIIPIETAVTYLKEAVVTSYGRKGQNIVDMNNGAIDQGIEALHKVEVPASWADAQDEPQQKRDLPEFITEVQEVMNRQEVDKLPVSKFAGDRADGTYPLGGAAYEKRGTAINVPVWNTQKCIGCNKCSYVCPHASIRPVLTTDEELAAAPEGFPSKDVRAVKDYHFTVAVSTMDCLGCGNCAQVCPVKALDMTPLDADEERDRHWQPVRAAAHRVLRRLRRLRRDAVRQAHHAALRRPHDDRQRHGLHLHLGRQRTGHAVHDERQGPRPSLG